MPDLPRQLQLTGGDYFIQAIDHQMRRAGLPGNVCRMAVRLEGTIDPEALRRRIAQSPLLAWLARVRMTRLLPVLSPRWRADAPPTEFFSLQPAPASGGDGADLSSTIDGPALCSRRAPALSISLTPRDGGAELVLAWHHALMDVRGADLLLRHLGESGEAENLNVLEQAIAPDQRCFSLARLWRGYLRRLLFSRESVALITETSREPFATLLRGAPPAAPRRNRFRAVEFSAEETARIDERAARLNASFRRSHFHLAATLNALHAVVTRRGGAPAAYVVPVPHDLRRRGAAGPIFSNQISFLFFRIEPELAGDLPATIGELTRQMMDQVRRRTPESFVAAMELFKPTPLGFYAGQLGRPTRGKFATFFFSDAGEACVGMDELLGARIAGVTHLAPASRPPGLTVVFSRFRGRLSAVLAWVDDCLDADEADLLEHGLRAALLGNDAL